MVLGARPKWVGKNSMFLLKIFNNRSSASSDNIVIFNCTLAACYRYLKSVLFIRGRKLSSQSKSVLAYLMAYFFQYRKLVSYPSLLTMQTNKVGPR